MKKRIALLGPPASGKGTQAELIMARYQIPTASPGGMLREERRQGTPLGIAADKLTSQGQLVSDDIIMGLVSNWLERHDGAFVFDGFPRSVVQAEGLESLLAARSTPLDVAILLETDIATIEQRVLRRMSCNRCGQIVSVGLHVASVESPCPKCGAPLTKRSDDNLETLKHRLVEYKEKTEPVCDFYRRRGLLKTIPSMHPPTEVFASIAAVLEAE